MVWCYVRQERRCWRLGDRLRRSGATFRRRRLTDHRRCHCVFNLHGLLQIRWCILLRATGSNGSRMLDRSSAMAPLERRQKPGDPWCCWKPYGFEGAKVDGE